MAALDALGLDPAVRAEALAPPVFVELARRSREPRVTAPAKINLALVVGPLRDDGKHEVATVLQRISLADRIALGRARATDGVGLRRRHDRREALQALAAAAASSRPGAVEIEKTIPVAAGLGGGSSDAAAALRLANDAAAGAARRRRLERARGAIGADVPFFLTGGPQLGTGDGTVLDARRPAAATTGSSSSCPAARVKTSTADVYRAFDARDGADGFDERRAALLAALAAVRRPAISPRCPPNDLASLAARGAAARAGCVPRRRQRRRPVRLRPLRRPRRAEAAAGRCARGRRPGSPRRARRTPPRRVLPCLP